MELTRRKFLQLTGAAAAAAALVGAGVRESVAAAERIRIHYGQEIPTICTFCGVGCGILCNVQNDVIVNIEGDPEHAISEGTVCSKGASHYNLSYIYDHKGRPQINPSRLTKPLYREAYGTEYKEVEWDWALKEIAKRVKETRDGDNPDTGEPNFETVDVNGVTVNRNNAIGWIGSAFCTNEENYLFQKMIRALGIVSMDHCARL